MASRSEPPARSLRPLDAAAVASSCAEDAPSVLVVGIARETAIAGGP